MLEYPTDAEDVTFCGASVIRPWLEELTLKQQTVLLSAVRGCDGVGKEDLSKKLVRTYRGVILHNAAPTGQFMRVSVTPSDCIKFLNSMDHYPMHWLFHFLHAVEIVGYFHPNPRISRWWINLYFSMVNALHLAPESAETNQNRLQDGFSRDCWKT